MLFFQSLRVLFVQVLGCLTEHNYDTNYGMQFKFKHAAPDALKKGSKTENLNPDPHTVPHALHIMVKKLYATPPNYVLPFANRPFWPESRKKPFVLVNVRFFLNSLVQGGVRS